MSSISIGCIGILLLLAAIFLRMPIGMAMLAVGTAGFAAISGTDAALGLLRGVPYETFANPTYAVVCLFLLMGNFAFKSGISDELFACVNTWLGRLRGGLAIATVAACGGFAAICGSSVACAVTMGVVAFPEMRKFRYANTLATGCIAAGGTLGILIPPSTVMVLYGIITGQSIGDMFMAGFIPGLLQIALYMAVVRFWVKRRPADGPAGQSRPMKDKLRSLTRVWSIVLLFSVVIGGLYLGVFSPNEAAELSSVIAGVVESPMLVVSGVLLVMVILGCFMDSMAIVLLTVPIFFPLIETYHIDPIWFGILVVRVTEIGLITPPVGLNLFVIKGVANVPMASVFRGVVPFLCADALHIALLMAFPVLSLWLPGLAGN